MTERSTDTVGERSTETVGERSNVKSPLERTSTKATGTDSNIPEHNVTAQQAHTLTPRHTIPKPSYRTLFENIPRHILELDADFGLAFVERLARTHDERDAIPALVVDLEHARAERRRLRVVGHARVIAVPHGRFFYLEGGDGE